MPNYIANRIIIEGSTQDMEAVILTCKNIGDGGKEIAMDFNEIIPEPAGLNIACPFIMYDTIYYLVEISKPSYLRDCKRISEFHDKVGDNLRKYIDLGRAALVNIAKHSAPTWYEWRLEHWGTKWNAFNSSRNENTITFDTAGRGVIEIVKTLSAKFPDVIFEYIYADEDIGYNCGKYKICRGQIIHDYGIVCGSVDAYELALELHPESADNYEFVNGEYQYKYDE